MGVTARRQAPLVKIKSPYAKILTIDGAHPFKDKAAFSYVEYAVRRRKGGKIGYFNFDLAKEMGLIADDHGSRLNQDLVASLLEAFGHQIINEYDLIHGTRIDPKDIKPGRFMATRYLQLQHPGRIGHTSGDGRSIWNGVVRHKGKTWDISSRGTGATCLSPATAINKKFYKTGDTDVAYGCGYAWLSEGIGDVLFTEVFHKNAIPTERVLCVIEYPGNLSITVRAGLNLLRPSHMFLHLKQGRHDRLKNVVDYFIDRQTSNKVWSKVPNGKRKYKFMLERFCETFAKMSAQFESEYLFCWLDWDGDNILADGGIIDFGSIRQFGLYHHEYRYDDDARWSTNVKEQKYKARYIVQTFAQMTDFLMTGKKKDIKSFQNAAVLKDFDRIFREAKRKYLMRRIGLVPERAELICSRHPKVVSRFETIFYHFEAIKSKKGPVKVPDGITWDAVFCMRSLLRELPLLYTQHFAPIEAKLFMRIMRSSYAKAADCHLNWYMRHKIATFQKAYLRLIECLAEEEKKSPAEVLKNFAARARLLNRHERVTGDAINNVADILIEKRKRLTGEQLQRVIELFVKDQVLDPDEREALARKASGQPSHVRNMMNTMLQIVKNQSEGL